ncbi:chemotaxis protein CheB [Nibribacter koreensis]|uniref:protein-glutamate methylesterase n=1 Tax=Nibribacter koreensis TaxID=1084519 RepID=A0ABP8F8I3_9BACT
MLHAPNTKIKVLIGDTSVRSRLVLSGMINAEPHLEVVDTAQTKDELLSKAFDLQPDVIVAQPGLTVSGKLPLFRSVYKDQSPLLLMVSQKMELYSEPNLTDQESAYVLQSDSSLAAGKLVGVKVELMNKLRALVKGYGGTFTWRGMQPEVEVLKVKYHPTPVINPAQKPLCLVVLGASTGGSTAVEYVLRDLEVQQPTVVLVAIHMPEKFTKRLARRLQKVTKWQVEEGRKGMALQANTVIIAPGGHDMFIRRNALKPDLLTLDLVPATSAVLDSPSVDTLMQSAAYCAGEHVMGIIMTGMGQDGTKGAQEIRNMGGVIIAQNAETSSIFGMAKSAIENGVVNGVVALGQIHSMISRFAAERHLSHTLQRDLSR